MKNRLKRLAPLLVMFCFFLAIFPQQEAQARKLFGKEKSAELLITDPNGTCGDGCLRFARTYDSYFLGIRTGSRDVIECDCG